MSAIRSSNLDCERDRSFARAWCRSVRWPPRVLLAALCLVVTRCLLASALAECGRGRAALMRSDCARECTTLQAAVKCRIECSGVR